MAPDAKPRVFLFSVLLVALSACSGGASEPTVSDPSPPTSGDSVVGEVPVTSTQETAMIITVFEDMCGSPCQEQDGAAYVFDPTGRLFDEVRLALAESTRPVVFVESREDLAQVYNELPEDEAVVSFSELRRFGDDVVGIDTSVATSPESGVSRSWLFRWTGSTWELADPVDVGVTVTTSVS